MRIFNSMTRKKEEFRPIHPGKVGMYACGPTVYSYIHIGNARPFIIFDVLRRYLEHIGYEVTFIQNFTDIDDKMIERANKEGITVKKLGDKFIEEYFIDTAALGILPATVHPRATEHIPEIIELIARLIEKGHAYATPCGDIFYRVSSFPGYGKLSGQSLEELETGASDRVDVETDKESPADFALWKSQKPGEPAWESPWGMGRPGWHIECSAMSMKYLGETFDIHCGGKDLLFPHHENEIAQSEGATCKPFANYWVHNGFINIINEDGDPEKISKTLGNADPIRKISRKFDPEAVRLFILSAHYRSPIDFSLDQIEAATSSLNRLYNAKDNLIFQIENGEDRPLNREEKIFTARLKEYATRFNAAMDDDLNTADALAAIFELVKDTNIEIRPGSAKIAASIALEHLQSMCGVLGILTKKAVVFTVEVQSLLDEREHARLNKDWKRSDELREAICAAGYILEDTKQGQKVRKVLQ